MTGASPTLHMFCGKIASGKSTLAAKLADAPNTVLIAEDAWLAALFADQLQTGQDFMRCSAQLRTIMGPHVVALLCAGTSVVLDFQANTVESRVWMRQILDQSDAAHQLHVLMPSDAVCMQRLQARNAASTHAFTVTEAQFHQFSKYFVAPLPEEGFTQVIYGEADAG